MRNKINKIIIFLILAIFFTPAISSAVDVIPHANLTIIVNTQGIDTFFNFELIEHPYYSEQISLETENLSGSTSGWLYTFSGDEHYFLRQENVPGLKIDRIFCESDNPDDVFFYQPDTVSFSPITEENIICTFDNNIETQGKTPVLIVPGLTGTELKEENELIWADLGKMLGDVGDDFMDTLAFNKDLAPNNTFVSIVDVIRIKNFLGFKYDYLEGLINEFINQGYVENETLFAFPYDWRYGVSGEYADGKTNVDLLDQKIKDILGQTGSNEVDIVAHSLGGLIVKKYVADNPANHKINKAVFVGVPSTGAPKAVKVLLQGDNFGIPWLSQKEIKKISENLPASYDLLPSRQYYESKGSYIKVIEQVEPTTENPTVQNTLKDLNYDESKSFLTNDHLLNFQGISSAESLHSQDFDNFDLRTAGVDLYAIDGCKTATIGGIVERRYTNIFGNKSFAYNTPRYVPGDGTVTLESATNLSIDQNKKYYALVSDHGKMPSENGIRQEIVNLVAGSSLEVSPNLVTQDIDKCELNGKGFSVFSPVNIFIEDQFGNKLGLSEDGSIINEIPGADFEIWGEHKFVFVPTDGEQVYNINLMATGPAAEGGSYTIKSDDIQNSQTTKTEIFSNLSATAELTGTINIDPDSGATSLIIKKTPDSQEQIILPDSVLTTDQPIDYFPPVSTVNFSGESANPESRIYKSNVEIQIKASDLLPDPGQTGVLNINYNLDNAGFQKITGDTVNLTVETEGRHVLIFFSTDKAGNNEQEQTIEFTIDKTAPEAVIEFDPELKDLKFTGKDNFSENSDVSILYKDNIITLQDQAGNTTEIKFKDKNRKILMRAEIKSIKYNGVLAEKNKNQMIFFWVYDKNKNLKILSQYVKSKNDYNILAVFNGKNTTFFGRDSSGKIFKTEKGLKIIQITTDKGNLNWRY